MNEAKPRKRHLPVKPERPNRLSVCLTNDEFAHFKRCVIASGASDSSEYLRRLLADQRPSNGAQTLKDPEAPGAEKPPLAPVQPPHAPVQPTFNPFANAPAPSGVPDFAVFARAAAAQLPALTPPDDLNGLVAEYAELVDLDQDSALGEVMRQANMRGVSPVEAARDLVERATG